MLVNESVSCPFCGQQFALEIDTSVPAQQFTSDCEICCRPLDIRVACEPGEVLDLQIQ